MLRHTSFPNALICHILNIGLQALVTPATLWASVTLVTGQTKSMGQSEPDIILMSLVLHGEIVTHVVILFLSNTLTQVSRSRSYDSVSPRRHSRLTSPSRGKKKKKHSKSHSSKRDKSKKKHKRKRSPSPPLSPLSSSVSSDSSSSPRRSPARKKSRITSRSPSLAGVNPKSASRTASPASHWDHLSLYADSNDEFNSHSEDAQDLVPDNTDPVLESQSESLRRTWDLLTLSKKFLNFFRPTCFLGKLKSC